MVAAEVGQGLILIIQLDEDSVLERCQPGYIDSFPGSKENVFMNYSAREYLERLDLIGDGAVILNRKGDILAVSSLLVPHNKSTHTVPIPSTGSRHISAQKVTEESQAIAFVVSEDGPITVFVKGAWVFRVI